MLWTGRREKTYDSNFNPHGIAAVNEPQFTYYVKKLYCPYCKRRKYPQIINLNEIQDTSVSSIVKAGKKMDGSNGSRRSFDCGCNGRNHVSGIQT